MQNEPPKQAPEVKVEEAPLPKFVNKAMGSCYTNYSLRAKECKRCAMAFPCSNATESIRRKIDIARRPDCSPFEYLISLLRKSLSLNTQMIEGCLVYIFSSLDNGEPMIFIAVEKDSTGADVISIKANDNRQPLEFSSIESYDKAEEIAKRFQF
jgi:hypothetical protein